MDRTSSVVAACVAALCLAMIALIAVCADPAYGDPAPAITSPSVEGGACIALWPDRATSLSAAIGIRVAEVGGRLVFVDGLKAAGYTALGVAVSMQPASTENGMRLGLCGWREDAGTRFAVYLRQALVAW